MIIDLLYYRSEIIVDYICWREGRYEGPYFPDDDSHVSGAKAASVVVFIARFPHLLFLRLCRFRLCWSSCSCRWLAGGGSWSFDLVIDLLAIIIVIVVGAE